MGHFIGALGIVLCAFVEYPGFPLTNLPTPLRGALQGGELLQCCALDIGIFFSFLFHGANCLHVMNLSTDRFVDNLHCQRGICSIGSV